MAIKAKKLEALKSLKLKLATNSLLDVEEAAAFLGLSVFTVRAYVARREIPFLKLGAAVRLDPTALIKWRDQKNVPTLAEQFRSEKASAVAGASRRSSKIAAAGAGAQG